MVKADKEQQRDRPRFEARVRMGRNRFSVVLDDVDITRLKVAVVLLALGLVGFLLGLDRETLIRLIRLIVGE